MRLRQALKIGTMIFAMAGVLSIVVLLPQHRAKAADTSLFQAGRIIDDDKFTDWSSMSAQQIQDFLNQKSSVCLKDFQSLSLHDDNGDGIVQDSTTEAYGPDTMSAAQLIAAAAKIYKISPKVILVTLQKEQGLITRSDCPSWRYNTALGYGCPDTAPCDQAAYGFTRQIDYGTYHFRGFFDDSLPSVPYGVGNQTIGYNPDSSCGSSVVYIQNRATASLYSYTPYQPNSAAIAAGYGEAPPCGAYGNRNFFNYWTDWFGSPAEPMPTTCNSKVAGVSCVWSLRKSDGSQFLTSSETELSYALKTYGWMNEGIVFYVSSTQKTGTIPVYRLQQNGTHYYTADQAEYTSLIGSGNWSDEGIAFYALPATSSNGSYKVFKLRDPATSQYRWVREGSYKDYLINIGYQQVSQPFNTLSGLAAIPIPSAGRDSILQLRNLAGYFYTTNISEVDSTIKMGFSYEGVLTTANSSGSGSPIYRLQNRGMYFYTASTYERDNAVSKYGYVSEGIGFYTDSTSSAIYRLHNTANGSYQYSTSVDKVMSLANTSGWVYEGTMTDSSSTSSPVYRFLNTINHRHFYTIDMDEGARIANKGWQYETVAFLANTSSGQPVYRLLSYDKHFYTANPNEKDIAINKYGYLYEGVAFYVSPTTTSQPAYRLQGGNDEYFYTASAPERDTAESKYGYAYEGEGFYLPAQ